MFDPGSVERWDLHVCTCGDCEVEPFEDRCRWEIAAKRGAALVEHQADRLERGIISADATEVLRGVAELLRIGAVE